MSGSLYEQDFYLWSRSQAEALRARRLGANDIDYDRVAEEIEDLGSEQRHAVSSFAELIIQHLYKLHWTRREEPVGHWLAEIETFRGQLRRRLTGSIRILVATDLEEMHRSAGRIAALKFRAEEPGTPVDPSLRWTWKQIIGEASDDPMELQFPIAREDGT